MKTGTIGALMLGIAAAPLIALAPAMAQPDRDYRWHGDQPNWDAARDYRAQRRYDRRMRRDDRIYRGNDGRYYCRRSNGSTGLVVGGIGGALAGGAIGGDTLGALVGAGAGALLGRSIDRGDVHCR